jgi:hypothetical protein
MRKVMAKYNATAIQSPHSKCRSFMRLNAPGYARYE